MTNYRKNFENECEFAETLAAILYGEANEIEQRQFDLHVLDCAVCRAEIESFGAIRRSIADWREQDFVSLPVPNIAARFDAKPLHFALPAKRFWHLAELREKLFSSMNFLQGTGAFATFLIAAALLGVLVYAVSKPNLIRLDAEVQPPAIEELSAQQQQPAIEDSQEIAAVAAPQQTPPKAVAPPEKAKTSVADSKSASAPFVRRRSNAANNVAPPKNVTVGNAVVELNANEPIETEDDTLRLSDLFDDLTPGGE
jgi:hypothetical protein